jgi:hypothetical protein
VEPVTITAGIAFVLGAAYRRARGKAAGTTRRDRRADRVLPASWEQESDIYALAEMVARRDDRHADHVLAQYGAFTYDHGRAMNGPRPGMKRRRLTRRDAGRVIARMMREENVKLDKPDRERFKRGADVLARRDDEEDF